MPDREISKTISQATESLRNHIGRVKGFDLPIVPFPRESMGVIIAQFNSEISTEQISPLQLPEMSSEDIHRKTAEVRNALAELRLKNDPHPPDSTS